jgi:CRP-like cAMP-binding protein
MQSQTMKTEMAKKELLQGVKFLDFLDPSDINKLVHTMVPRVFNEGEYITRKGDEGDTLYVIQEGKVCVTEVSNCSAKKENQELGPGDHFGETALLHKEDHVKCATVVGVTKGLALSIDKETFEKVVGDIATLAIQAEDKQILVRAHHQRHHFFKIFSSSHLTCVFRCVLYILKL